jgi:predicted acetyltransferase
VSLAIRPLTPSDDLEPELDLMHRAFGPGDREHRLAVVSRTVAAGRLLGAYDGATLVASAAYHDMRQWWRGRSLRMAGVAAVKVAPEERGRGTGRALMTELAALAASRGYPLSTLYPATLGVYRATGWEVAGARYDTTIPLRSLRHLERADPLAGADDDAAELGLRRAGPADAAALIALEGELHAASRDCGPSSFDPVSVAAQLDDPGVYCYLARDGELTYQWNRPAGEVTVYLVAAGSGATARALWGIVASHATMAERVRAITGPDDLVGWLVREPDVTQTRREPWMLRLLDAPAAVAGRGFPETARAAAVLEVRDEQLPANAGRWRLEVSGGTGTLTPETGRAGGPALRLGARGLAALYAGTRLRTLRQAGLAAGGDPAADPALDDAFAATPYMLDYF